MKPLSLLLALSLVSSAWAQDPKPEEKPVEKPAAEKPAKPTPPELPPLPDPAGPDSRTKPSSERDAALVPEAVPKNRKPPGSSQPSRGTTTLKPPTTSVDLDARIRYRKAHSRAASEPAVRAFWEESRTARTDYDKREALKGYYTTLYKRMLAFDKGIAPMIEERKKVALRRLDQTRIDPTDPLDDDHRLRRD